MEFVTYRKFFEEGQAHALADILKSRGIDYQISEDRDSLDSLYGDKQFNRRFFVKIKPVDFPAVDSLLSEQVSKQLNDVDKEHYLFGFSDEELFDILSKPDEWNEFDYLLARKILQERGKEINNATVELLKKQRINELAKPEESHTTWIYAGYILALLGGLIGIFIGWHLITYKKTLPDGQRIYGHKPEDRRHGWNIVLIGVIMLTISVAIRIMND